MIDTETEYIKTILYKYHPNSKLVGEITQAEFNNGTLSISFISGVTWLYMLDRSGNMCVYKQHTKDHHGNQIKQVLRDLKLNELTSEC